MPRSWIQSKSGDQAAVRQPAVSETVLAALCPLRPRADLRASASAQEEAAGFWGGRLLARLSFGVLVCGQLVPRPPGLLAPRVRIPRTLAFTPTPFLCFCFCKQSCVCTF